MTGSSNAPRSLPQCDHRLSELWYREPNARCAFAAKFMSPDGKRFCRQHADNIAGCLPIELALLKINAVLLEFYQAATAKGMIVEAVHSSDCAACHLPHSKKFGPCDCGMATIQDRADAARASAGAILSQGAR